MTTETESQQPAPIRVDIVDIDIPFGSLVWFFFKCALASIPTTIIFALAILFIMRITH